MGTYSAILFLGKQLLEMLKAQNFFLCLTQHYLLLQTHSLLNTKVLLVWGYYELKKYFSQSTKGCFFIFLSRVCAA